MKINYFDMGLYNGEEIHMMLNIFKNLSINDYKIYGFEAFPNYYENCKQRFSNNKNIEIIGKAIGSKNGKIPLYISSNAEGHSIYSSKNNVSNKFVEIESIIFSEWLLSIPDFKESFNILKANIEGSEWDLLKDISDNNLLGCFEVYCGAWGDVYKVKELQNIVSVYNDIISKNNITLHRFTYYKPEKNANMRQILEEKIKIFEVKNVNK